MNCGILPTDLHNFSNESCIFSDARLGFISFTSSSTDDDFFSTKVSNPYMISFVSMGKI